MARKPNVTRQRIVSLAPSVTSILIEIGARRSLVAVSKWCADVADVGNLPRLGDCWAIEPGAIESLKPTMVIGSVPFRTEAVAKILELPVPFVALNPRNLADVYSDIELLGRLAGLPTGARKLVARMQSELDSIRRIGRAAVKRHANRPRVYSEAWPHPRISSPPWVAELVEIAGGEFVGQPGKRIDDEQVAAAEPQIIVLAWAATGDKSDPQQALESKAWQAVPAVRNKHVFAVRDELLNTPGPPLVEGARTLLDLIHASPGQSASKKVRAAHR
ncbi:MAG TPA: ABC transporter substrate-binding protein [Candidatus Acidoferrales bacterium]|nr:ABC transporter substrate-binding protein [Candidatus Acidoferrales bacterium]